MTEQQFNEELLLGDRMPVIGIHGGDRSGKDTVAKYLVERYEFYRRAFADELKEVVYDLNPLIRTGERKAEYLQDLLYGHGEDFIKENYPDYRKFLIEFGTNTMRVNLGFERIWVDHLKHHVTSINEWVDDPVGLVIPDVRDSLEASVVLDELGGYLIELRSNRETGRYESVTEAEAVAARAQYVIINNGSLEELYGQVDALMESIFRDYEVEQEAASVASETEG